MLIKLVDAFEGEMFDFGHEANIKELRETIHRFLKETDEEKTRLVVKILPACA